MNFEELLFISVQPPRMHSSATPPPQHLQHPPTFPISSVHSRSSNLTASQGFSLPLGGDHSASPKPIKPKPSPPACSHPTIPHVGSSWMCKRSGPLRTHSWWEFLGLENRQDGTPPAPYKEHQQRAQSGAPLSGQTGSPALRSPAW